MPENARLVVTRASSPAAGAVPTVRVSSPARSEPTTATVGPVPIPAEAVTAGAVPLATIEDAWSGQPNVLYLSPLAGGWSDFHTVDGTHPDAAGHQLITRRIIAAMKRAGLVSRGGSE